MFPPLLPSQWASSAAFASINRSSATAMALTWTCPTCASRSEPHNALTHPPHTRLLHCALTHVCARRVPLCRSSKFYGPTVTSISQLIVPYLKQYLAMLEFDTVAGDPYLFSPISSGDVMRAMTSSQWSQYAKGIVKKYTVRERLVGKLPCAARFSDTLVVRFSRRASRRRPRRCVPASSRT